MGSSTSWNPLGLSRPVMGLLYLYLYMVIYIAEDPQIVRINYFEFAGDIPVMIFTTCTNSVSNRDNEKRQKNHERTLVPYLQRWP
jgi:hypothetical protein